MCFAQGVMWTLVLNGWRHWNRSSQFNGRSAGARMRRWWWGVNKWKIPGEEASPVGEKVSKVSTAFLNVGNPPLTHHSEQMR
jgi:hypothetical protein